MTKRTILTEKRERIDFSLCDEVDEEHVVQFYTVQKGNIMCDKRKTKKKKIKRAANSLSLLLINLMIIGKATKW